MLRQDSIDRATFNYQSSEIKQNPASYRGNLFVFGGIIVSTTAVERGSLIEALYAPVDSRGYLKNVQDTGDRYLAIYPKDYGFLDPMIFREGREITMAGEFIGLQTGKIDEMDYIFPVFQIEEVHLWRGTSKEDPHTSDSFHSPLISGDGRVYLYESREYVRDEGGGSPQKDNEDQVKIPSVQGSTKSADVKVVEPSEAQELTGRHTISKDKPEEADRSKVSTKSESQEVDRKESPVADTFSEKTEIRELPDSEKQPATVEASELSKEEKNMDEKKSVDVAKKSPGGAYYVQVGAWKKHELAERMFNKVRGKYPEAYMFIEHDLYKVRIPGVRTREEGIDISRDIEKKFNIKPMIVRNP